VFIASAWKLQAVEGRRQNRRGQTAQPSGSWINLGYRSLFVVYESLSSGKLGLAEQREPLFWTRIIDGFSGCCFWRFPLLWWWRRRSLSFNTVRMRLLETLGGAVSLGLAVCLGFARGDWGMAVDFASSRWAAAGA